MLDNNPPKFVCKFALKKATKNTYQYEEDAGIPKIGRLYVQKHVLGEEPAQNLQVTVEAV